MLQLLVTAAMSFWAELTPRSAAASQAARVAALLWPQDLSQERRALEAQHWVTSFPAAVAAAAAGTAGGTAAAHQVEQPCQPLAAEMAAWLAEHCPEVGIADLQRWALTLRICTLTILPPDKRPERLVTQLLCECQRVLNAIPPAAASGGHSRSLLAASGAGNLARRLSKPASAAREKRLAELLQEVQDRAIASECE